MRSGRLPLPLSHYLLSRNVCAPSCCCSVMQFGCQSYQPVLHLLETVVVTRGHSVIEQKNAFCFYVERRNAGPRVVSHTRSESLQQATQRLQGHKHIHTASVQPSTAPHILAHTEYLPQETEMSEAKEGTRSSSRCAVSYCNGRFFVDVVPAYLLPLTR